MRNSVSLALVCFVLFGAASAGAQEARPFVPRDELEALVRDVVAGRRKPFPRGQDPEFLKTSRNPDLFHAVARLTTRDWRELDNVLIQEVWWGADSGDVVVLEIEQPKPPFKPEYVLAEELLAMSVETPNGVIHHFAWNEDKKVLTRCKAPVHISERDMTRADMAFRLAEQRESQKPSKLSRIEVVRDYYRKRLTPGSAADRDE